MSDAEATLECPQPLTARQAALSYITERRRQDPDWDYLTDPTYVGPHPTFVGLMGDAEYDRHIAGFVARGQLTTNQCAPRAIERNEPEPMPRRVVRAALPFGQRIRELRRALGWTQREVAWELGVSARSVIRYEQGRSAPLQSAPLLASLEFRFREQGGDRLGFCLPVPMADGRRKA